jgi:hypothetical protein
VLTVFVKEEAAVLVREEQPPGAAAVDATQLQSKPFCSISPQIIEDRERLSTLSLKVSASFSKARTLRVR